MKTLLTLFVLLFSSSLFAEDISDFEIEGISIGESALDFFSEDEIKKHISYYKNKSFYTSTFHEYHFFEQYDSIMLSFKSDDKNFIIYSIGGTINYTNNIDECDAKKSEIEKYLLDLLKNIDWKNYDYEDEEGIFRNTYTTLKTGEDISISCYDWVSEMNYIDDLRVGLHSKEFSDWLNNEAN